MRQLSQTREIIMLVQSEAKEPFNLERVIFLK